MAHNLQDTDISENHKESLRNQHRERELKVQLLRKQVEDRDKQIRELEEKNWYLTQFYREHKNQQPRCGEDTATFAAGEGNRTRQSVRERIQHRNDHDLIEAAPTDSPLPASSLAVASRRVKPSVNITKDQKLISDTKQKPTKCVPRCTEGAATSATSEGNSTRQSIREGDQHCNYPNLIEPAPTNSPSAASS